MKTSGVTFRHSLVWRAAFSLILTVALGIGVMAGVGYWKLYRVTDENASIRIDRAARAATSILLHAEDGQFVVEREEDGRPVAIRLTTGTPEQVLSFTPEYDALLAEIGSANQGAANLFSLNAETLGFDRFATTFRRPDGSMPPPMSIAEGHPAYGNLINNVRHVGEVPVMGRLRLAYLLPIQASTGAIAGALAVDVGWVDDLIVARERLWDVMWKASTALLLVVGAIGLVIVRLEMRPLGIMARFANDVASGERVGQLPFTRRKDEVGALAQGLARVVDLQEELAYLAYTDPLTKCGNRARYFADLARVVETAKTADGHAALIHFNLSQFSKINVAHGQRIGDEVLKHAASEAALVFGNDAVVYRATGDNFCVIVKNAESSAVIEKMCRRAVSLLDAPIELGGCDVQLEAYMGVVLLPDDAADADKAHSNAELALRAAKIDDGVSVVFFSSKLSDKAQRHFKLESMLRKAIDGGDLALHYQPQICVQTRQVYGLEALVRWEHPEEGAIGPNEFIPVAEQSGLIGDLGDWVLNEACRQAKVWLDAGFVFRHVSVNVSPTQLWQPGFAQAVEACLEKHGVDGKYIYLEVTESIFVKDDESRISTILGHLRKLGVRFSLDDFGSGYSSLGYLRRLPFDQIKIDRAFVAGAHEEEDSASLLAGMMALGNGLGMTIIAEGAETAEEVALLRRMDCDAIQGFFYSKAVTADAVGAVLDAVKTDRRFDVADSDHRISA